MAARKPLFLTSLLNHMIKCCNLVRQVLVSSSAISIQVVAIETAGGKRNLNMNINAQQAILKA